MDHPLLRSVSRSFYISIRLLPKKLREPVALAYLLARAADTLADTSHIDVAARKEALQSLAGAIQTGKTIDLPVFAEQQTNAAERRLIELLPKLLQSLDAIDAQDCADIRDVLSHITRGQMLDLERPVLNTPEELNEYIYLVAGSVGEFWTRICFRHLPRFATLPADEMMKLGRAYGEGLQLINVLRDAGADLRAGRSYVPGPREPWYDAADAKLFAGVQYSCAIRNWRVRFATVLPALIGGRTLALLRAAGSRALEDKIKAPRREVRRLMLRLAAHLASRPAIGREMARASAGPE